MDRIRKALDLAREERGRPFDAVLDEPRPFESGPPLRGPTIIRYTKTTAFSPSRELLESHCIIDSLASTAAGAAFRMLRTQILQRMHEHEWQSLAVLSPGSDDGKTTTAINLAISLASDQRHTALLVDFDFKRPSIAVRLGIEPSLGVDDVLRGDAGIEACLYHPEHFERLVVLPARLPLESSSEVLAGPRCRELVAELKSRYPDRILVFDLPPVLGADDALAFAPLVDCALVVIAEGATRRADLLRCMELLRKTPVVGTVLNRALDVPAAYG